MKSRPLIVIAAALTALVTGCSSDTTTTTTTTFTTTTIPAITVPEAPVEAVMFDVSSQDLAAVVSGDRQFGFDLMSTVGGDENMMISPYSIATALTMLYLGARGETASEISEVLHVSVDDEALHRVRHNIDLGLATTPAVEGAEARFTIRPANSTWGQEGYSFLPEYLENLSTYYGSGMQSVDFAGDPEDARLQINGWVQDATEDRIKDLIPPGKISVTTRLALVNAIWFKAEWLSPFWDFESKPDLFALPDGTQVEATMVNGAKWDVPYAETELFTAIRLAYKGDASMVMVLPKEGTPMDLIEILGSDGWDFNWEENYIGISFPRFEFESEVNLQPLLTALGMPTAFVAPTPDSGADLSGITAIRELFVSAALHKTFIKVNEEGTEAAGASAVVGDHSGPGTFFLANRPFLFWIEQNSTGELLFLGQVTDPSK